jgi:Matrixin
VSRASSMRCAPLLAVGAAAASVTMAGGPLLVDPGTGTAFRYGPAPVPVYYDLGDFGVVWDYSTPTPTKVVFDNAVGANLVRTGYAGWSNVPTTSLRTKVEGNFGLKNLPNIDAFNITKIIGTSNGRGIYVVFDADGSIMQNFFGVSDGVLGISSPQYAIDGTTTVTESFVVLNGGAVSAQDTGAAAFQGVATHEFGHSLGLAHSQVNGAVVFFNDAVGPANCDALPYGGTPSRADVETMYPYIDPTPGTGSGVGQGDVHTLDSMASISDLYPGAGWPAAYGSIVGKVYDLNGKTQLTGVNVIARNVAAPYVGANSAISGQMTQGALGPDGNFAIHGLIPGQRYVLYLDALVAGGFSTPPQWFLPGAEPFYASGGNDGKYNPCRYTVIAARAGSVTSAPIKFRLKPGAPLLYQLGYGTGVTGLSGDGMMAVGNYGRGGPVFRWTAKTGVVPMHAVSTGEITSISDNGTYISTNLLDPHTDTARGAFRWDAANGWLPVAPLGNCGTDTTSNFAVDDSGAVYGLAYRTCVSYKAFRWTPKAGSMPLQPPSLKPNGQSVNSRVNKVSAAGHTIVGWQEDPVTGLWEGVVWNSGVPSVVRTPSGEMVDEVTAVSADGSLIGGPLYDGQLPLGNGYRRQATGGRMQWVAPLPGDASPATPNAMSGNGNVMAGFSGNPFLSFNPGPFIWTRELGTANLDDFLHHQGTATEQWISLWEPTAISDDGKVIGGWGVGYIGYAGWVLRIDTAFVCHPSDSSPGTGTKGAAKTIKVDFPTEFDQHLAHGDTVGPCRS